MQQSSLSQGFGAVWKDLFSSPVHLDSLLSRQTPKMKSLLAQILPQILLRPVSLAEDLGVGVTPGEPWSLSAEQLRIWSAAAQMAGELHERFEGGKIPAPRVLRDDFPPLFVEDMEQDWGATPALQLMEALVQKAPMTLRLSTRVSRDQMLEAWKKSGKFPVRITATPFAPLGIQFADYTPVFHLPEYEQGDFEIQDEGSQVMALFALDPMRVASVLSPIASAPQARSATLDLPELRWSGFRVVDACAGAGGKSLALADLMKGQGRVFSYDISERKIQALRRRATRAHLNNIQAMALPEGGEAAALERFEGTADRVLVDAPCSGWGVLRRNPDIKWRQDPQALERFPELQLRLLEVYSSLVKPGGILSFGTCTFRKAETLNVVNAFNERAQNRFRPIAGGYFGPSSLSSSSDGFFMHAWERITDSK
jgi:16S rRNA C967 or C1407 C5-methylase (RsmB/RsmF family)